MDAKRILIGLITIGSLTLSAALTHAEECKCLFDGKTLDGWAATGKPEGWTVEDGAITCTVKGGSYLYTKDEYENYVLSLDFKVSPPAPKMNPKTQKEEMHRCNSGVFIRWSNLKDPVNTGIEVQVYDSVGVEKPGKHDCGALYDMVAPCKNVQKPVDQWNHMVITCKGPLITVELNGVKISEMNEDLFTQPNVNPIDGTKTKYKNAWKDMPRKGHIGLQDHGSRVWYKNITLKQL